jgi:hypothetical protein
MHTTSAVNSKGMWLLGNKGVAGRIIFGQIK